MTDISNRIQQARIARLKKAKKAVEKRSTVFTAPDLCSTLFDQQRALLEAIEQKKSRQIVVSCTRRAGKSFGASSIINKMCRTVPGYRVAYGTDTRQHAKDLLLEYLETINELDWGPSGVWHADRQGYVRYPNKSRVYLFGFDKIEWVKKLLGKKFDLVVVDEAQDVRNDLYEFALKKVIKPTLADRAGQLLLIGTPSPLMEGHNFGRAYLQDKSFMKFNWTLLDNPHMEVWANRPDWKEYRTQWLEDERLTLGYSPDDPEWQREYLGMWTPDKSAFIFQITHENIIQKPSQLKENGRTRVLGVDVGFVDSAAFVILEYWPGGVRMVHEEGQPNMNLGAVMQKIDDMRRYYYIDTVVIDPSSGGRAMINELCSRYGKNWAKVAQRHQKDAAFRLMNTALRRKELFLVDRTKVLEQVEHAIWDKTHKKEAPTCIVDFLDACLYAFRECYFYYEEIQRESQAEPRSAQWFKDLANKLYDRGPPLLHEKDTMVDNDAGWI